MLKTKTGVNKKAPGFLVKMAPKTESPGVAETIPIPRVGVGPAKMRPPIFSGLLGDF